jgi:hypothetical protein
MVLHQSQYVTFSLHLITDSQHCFLSEICIQLTDMKTKEEILQRIAESAPGMVWTPKDFLDLANRDTVDKTLQRLVTSGNLRRIDRGLYDSPRKNLITKEITSPDYRRIIDAVGRRDQIRILIDGLTAANDLGLSNAIPGQVIVYTDGRLKPIRLSNLVIRFKLTAPSKLYWAGRPAMRIIQALHWLRDNIKTGVEIEQEPIKIRLTNILRDSPESALICEDLKAGLHTLPSWMQRWIRELLSNIQ